MNGMIRDQHGTALKSRQRLFGRDHILMALNLRAHHLPMLAESPIETRLATLEWSDREILVVGFKLCTSMIVEGVREVIAQRAALCANGPAAVLVVLPPDMDAEIDVSISDHSVPVRNCTIAEATVANGLAHRRLAELHYSLCPQPFPTIVLASEADALDRLSNQIRPVLS